MGTMEGTRALWYNCQCLRLCVPSHRFHFRLLAARNTGNACYDELQLPGDGVRGDSQWLLLLLSCVQDLQGTSRGRGKLSMPIEDRWDCLTASTHTLLDGGFSISFRYPNPRLKSSEWCSRILWQVPSIRHSKLMVKRFLSGLAWITRAYRY